MYMEILFVILAALFIPFFMVISIGAAIVLVAWLADKADL